jgi:hypothetical protein
MVWCLVKHRDNFNFTFYFTFSSAVYSQSNRNTSLSIRTRLYGLDDRGSILSRNSFLGHRVQPSLLSKG